MGTFSNNLLPVIFKSPSEYNPSDFFNKVVIFITHLVLL